MTTHAIVAQVRSLRRSDVTDMQLGNEVITLAQEIFQTRYKSVKVGRTETKGGLEGVTRRGDAAARGRPVR